MTGAEPRRLSVSGAGLEGVLYLRELADSDAIRERIERGGKLVVIGGGWIGAEVAASARERGADVTMLYPSAVPLERILGAEAAAFYRDLHASHGVELLAETRLEAFEGDGKLEGVRTAEGRRIDADFAVVGIGVEPRIELAERAGLAVENGVRVDEHLETSAPGIFAAGDVANARHPFFGRHIRIEHWRNARDQGPAAARNMLGRKQAYDPIPYFYSDQYDTAMEYWGHAVDWDDVVFRGDPAGGAFLVFWVKQRRVVAGMSVNVEAAGQAIQEIIRSAKEIERGRLADTETPLEDVVAEPVARREKPREKPLTRAGTFVAEGINFTRRFVGDRLARRDSTPIAELADGEARVLEFNGEKLAVFKDDTGTVHALSPVCTHRRCLVDWNAAEKTWDCPCHGSRFDHEGRVVRGPAREPLERKAV